MHRITRQTGDSISDEIELIEQEPAPVIFLTSASTDITAISEFLNENSSEILHSKIRALLISDLYHPAQIDHYLATTADKSKL